MYVVEMWWLPRGGTGGVAEGVAEGGAGAPGTPMVTTDWVSRLGSNSLPMERWRLPVEDTPLLDWTESVLRHLDCFVFRLSSLPGMVAPGVWFQLSRL